MGQYFKDRWELDMNFIQDYWFYYLIGIVVALVYNFFWFRKQRKKVLKFKRKDRHKIL
jgi:cbb3-type cytochrome oxidase subunit 3